MQMYWLCCRFGQDQPWPNIRCGKDDFEFAIDGLFCQRITSALWQCKQVAISVPAQSNSAKTKISLFKYFKY